MFGSTIEYSLRNFTEELIPVTGQILNDGSMHSFKKQAHPVGQASLDRLLLSLDSADIITCLYPFTKSSLEEIVQTLQVVNNLKCVIMFANTPHDAELNLLFQYFKISTGSKFNSGLGMFFNHTNNAKKWNAQYNSWKDMQSWEMRELFSLNYPVWISNWHNNLVQPSNDLIKISTREFLNTTATAIHKIINHCGLTPKKGIDEFANVWQSKQQYILDEFELLDHIVESAVSNQSFTWSPVCFISEGIIQKRLRSKGFELQCDGLNMFPTDSKSLHKLLYKCYN